MPTKTLCLRLICLLLVSMMSATAYSQSLHWAAHFGGADWDRGTAIATDDQGHVYCTGRFRDTVDFDPGAGVFNLTSGGTQDVFISKWDASGNFLWARQLGGPGWEVSHDLTTDKDGNIYVTGFFLGKADFDPGPDSLNLLSSMGGDAFICKLDSSGDLVWARQIGGNLAVTSYAIAVDDSGQVFTTGFFDGTADFDPGPGTHELTVMGYSDIFVSKLDASGNLVWVRQMSGLQGEVGHAIAVDDDGNVLTSGTFAGTVDFDPGPDTFNLDAGGEQEFYISKLDAAGHFQWAKQMGGDVGYAIAVDDVGDVYATGYYGWEDIAITKLHASGSVIWSKETGAFVGYDIAVDDAHQVYITGQFYGTRDFDPDTGTYNLTAMGSTDSYVQKLDASGSFLWARQLGGNEEVHTRSLALDNSGNIYTTGDFNGSADFNPGTGTLELTSHGSYDIFMHKLKPLGSGIMEMDFTDTFKLYPNPTRRNVVIEFREMQSRLHLVLRNISGQIINQRHERNSHRAAFPLDVASGVYLLEVIDQDNNKSVSRIIKK